MKRSVILKSASVLLGVLIVVSFVFSDELYPIYDESKNSDDLVLRLAHNQTETHPVGVSLQEFADNVTAADNGLEIEVYPNGQFGGEENEIEQVQMGAIDMAKVSAAALESFDEEYQVFSLPYVFTTQEQYVNAMNNSEMVQQIYQSSKDQGFIALTWFDSGQRSIYCKEPVALKSPEDLKGKKVRAQSSQTSINTINAMGGSATPMDFGEVYTGLQQGTVDCAENNETALIDNSHGEVAKGYTYTEHQRTPDILIISTKTIDKLTKEQFESIQNLAIEESAKHEERWDSAIQEDIEKASSMDEPVQFFEIDKTPFVEATQQMRDDYANESELNAKILADLQSYATEEENPDGK